MNISVRGLTGLFQEKIIELQQEPEFQWNAEKEICARDENDRPAIKLAVGNVPLDYDLWAGLRNPAVVGLYPAGLQEIWEFYANKRRGKVDEFGRQTIFQIPHSFNFACKNYNRVVIISVMMPYSNEIIEDYSQVITEKGKASSHVFARMFQDGNQILDKAVSRAGIDLITDDNAVIAMTNDTVNSISKEAVPLIHQGISHGPCKNGNYPQKSIAALMGLGQFGISRHFFRDEFIDGKVQRFVGPISSIIVFDKRDLVRDGSDNVKTVKVA